MTGSPANTPCDISETLSLARKGGKSLTASRAKLEPRRLVVAVHFCRTASRWSHDMSWFSRRRARLHYPLGA